MSVQGKLRRLKLGSSIAESRTMQNEKYDCQYKLSFTRTAKCAPITADCTCVPRLAEAQCHCAGLSQHWLLENDRDRDRDRDKQKKRNRHFRQHGLVAYIRADSYLDADQQRRIINDYCHDNNYFIKATYTDTGKPGNGLHEALQATTQADGLIAADLNRFVEFSEDRLRELRPFVHHFFCNPDKKLIAVQEGVDTGSVIGQENVMAVMNHVKEFS